MSRQHRAHGRAVVEPLRAELWREAARCRGASSSLFFPLEEDGEEVADAKAVCAACPVRDRCLEYALDAGEQFGVWGGTTPRERRRIRRRRRKIA